MPYGLAGDSATFYMLADELIMPQMEQYAFAYIDDIIIATKTYYHRVKWLTVVAKRIREAGLTINHKKYKLYMNEVRYFGVLVNKDGYHPDPKKI